MATPVLTDLLSACRLFSALEQRLPQLSGPALALLTASLPQLLPAGGNLRLWRQLGGVVHAHGSSLSAEQLCEVLPLVQAADLPLPVEWLTSCMHKIEVGGWACTSPGGVGPSDCQQQLLRLNLTLPFVASALLVGLLL